MFKEVLAMTESKGLEERALEFQQQLGERRIPCFSKCGPGSGTGMPWALVRRQGCRPARLLHGTLRLARSSGGL